MHAPCKSSTILEINLKIKIQVLVSQLKVHWVTDRPWNLLFDCFNELKELNKTGTKPILLSSVII